MLENENIINHSDVEFLTTTSRDLTLELLKNFLSDYDITSGFVFIRENNKSKTSKAWCDKLKELIENDDTKTVTYFDWNMDSGEDEDIVNIYKNCLPDKNVTFNKCKRISSVKKLTGIDSILSCSPPIPVFIFVKQYLKAGKSISTDYVRAVIDLPMAGTSSVDTLVQGLIGRCCGYHKNTDVYVFTDPKIASRYVQWINGDVPKKAVMSKYTRAHKDITVVNTSSAYYPRKIMRYKVKYTPNNINETEAEAEADGLSNTIADMHV